MILLSQKRVEVQKSHQSFKICWVKMTGGHDLLQMTTNNPTKFEQDLSTVFLGVVSTSVTGSMDTSIFYVHLYVF